jgi:perosamine synthetase
MSSSGQGHFLPYGRQWIDESDITAVVETLRSDFLTTGPQVEAFEAAFAEKVGARYAVAVCNATAALHLALQVAGIGPGDRVVTSPITFLASANAGAYLGAEVDFSDIDPVSRCIDPALLAAHWKADTKAVVAVDYAGHPADMPRIAAIARERGALVIEDACHAVGGRFFHEGVEERTGGHPWADMSTFSFHPVKTLTSGEGGMLVTDRKDLADAARCLRSHGMVRDAASFVGLGTDEGPLAEQGPWTYEMQDLGYNYRLTDLQCSLGRSQLERIDTFIERRRQIFKAYTEGFESLEWLQVPRLAHWLVEAAGSHEAAAAILSWHLYTVEIDFRRLGRTRSEVMQQLRGLGVGTQVLYIPVYLQPWYREQFGYGPGKCPQAEAFYAGALSLPFYPKMTDGDSERVIEAVHSLGRNL